MDWLERHILRSKSFGDIRGRVISNPVLQNPPPHLFPIKLPSSAAQAPGRLSREKERERDRYRGGERDGYRDVNELAGSTDRAQSASKVVRIIPPGSSSSNSSSSTSDISKALSPFTKPRRPPPSRPARTYEPPETRIPARLPVAPSKNAPKKNTPSKHAPSKNAPAALMDIELSRQRQYPTSTWPPKALKDRRMVEQDLYLQQNSNRPIGEKEPRIFSKSAPNTPKYVSLRRKPVPVPASAPMSVSMSVPVSTAPLPLSASSWTSKIETPSSMAWSPITPEFGGEPATPPRFMKNGSTKTQKQRPSTGWSSSSHGSLKDLRASNGSSNGGGGRENPSDIMTKSAGAALKHTRYGSVEYGGPLDSPSTRSNPDLQPRGEQVSPRGQHTRHISLDQDKPTRYTRNLPPLERPPPNTPLPPLPPLSSRGEVDRSHFAALARRGSREPLTLKKVMVNMPRMVRGRSLESLISSPAQTSASSATTPGSFYVFTPLEMLTLAEKTDVPKPLNLTKAKELEADDGKEMDKPWGGKKEVEQVKMMNNNNSGSKELEKNNMIKKKKKKTVTFPEAIDKLSSIEGGGSGNGTDRYSLEVPLTIDRYVRMAIATASQTSSSSTASASNNNNNNNNTPKEMIMPSPSSVYAKREAEFDFWIEMGLMVEPKTKTRGVAAVVEATVLRPQPPQPPTNYCSSCPACSCPFPPSFSTTSSRCFSSSCSSSSQKGPNDLGAAAAAATADPSRLFLHELRGSLMVYNVKPINQLLETPSKAMHDPPSGWALYDDIWAGSKPAGLATIIATNTTTNTKSSSSSSPRYGFVLTSPRYDFAGIEWQRQLEATWKVLGSRMYPVLDSSQSSVGTHVHISPTCSSSSSSWSSPSPSLSPSSEPGSGSGAGAGCWTLFEVKAIAKAGIYFERAVDSLVGAGQRRNPWCRSNRHNVRLAGMSVSGILGEVNDCSSVQEVVDLVCPPPPPPTTKGKGKGKGEGDDDMMVARFCYVWDFTGLKGDLTGSIAFRRAGGCLKKGQAAAWVRFAVGFVKAAVAVGNQYQYIDLDMIGDLARLERFVEKGMEKAGVEKVELLDVLKRLFEVPLAQGGGRRKLVADGPASMSVPVEMERMKAWARGE